MLAGGFNPPRDNDQRRLQVAVGYKKVMKQRGSKKRGDVSKCGYWGQLPVPFSASSGIKNNDQKNHCDSCTFKCSATSP
jgi:hypothetical protein